jgi:hypothetical protein|tara:strand:- start:2987 stop:3145 length:159 start_codon:yes stop_codon:yes gene_type:complete
MTYQDLLDKLQTIPDDQLEQDVEIVGECITEHYYEVDFKLDDDGYALQITLT